MQNDDILIIEKNNIDILIEDFKHITTIRIFGKGATFANVLKKSSDEFHIGINQTVNELSQCDMLVINDLHNIYLLNDDVFPRIKYILTPEYLHNLVELQNGLWTKVFKYLTEKKFKGKYIIYNLLSNPNPNPKYISLPSCLSSCNNAVDFVCIFLNTYVKNIECFGVGIFSGTNYSKLFVGNGHYHEKHCDDIRQLILNVCDEYSINVNFCRDEESDAQPRSVAPLGALSINARSKPKISWRVIFNYRRSNFS